MSGKNLIVSGISFLLLFSTACTSKQKSMETGQETTSISGDGTTGSSADVITLSELFSNKEKYNGRTVRVKGAVGKVNENIMGKNWIHINDGTLAGTAQDLTVTTTENVTNGEEVVFDGKIALNKDFGSGYMYEILMEDARVVRE